MMQKTAMRLARRSAVRNFESSALQPDFRILWNSSIFHRMAYQLILLDRLGASADRQVRDQLPLDRLSALWRAAFDDVDDCQAERGRVLLLADRRQDRYAFKLDFQRGSCDLTLVVPNLDVMQAFDAGLFHLVGDRMAAIARQSINARPDEKVSAESCVKQYNS